MAYENFIPTVWAEGIQRELERQHVFVADCNRQYEGDVKQQGDSVRILGVGKPTIKRTASKNFKLDAAENVEDTTVTMNINQIAYFNYKIDDIDKRQAQGGITEALNKETSEALADEMDKYVADFAKDKLAAKYNQDDVVVNQDNILDEIDKAIQKLYENDVKTNTEITITLPPRAWMIFKKAYILLDTNNSSMIKNGKVAMYGNAEIKLSNNVAKSTDKNTDYIMCRTKRAVAFANPIIHVEPYRPENGFSDAVKGYALFDGKIVRPKEMSILNWKYA